jgi:sulfoxide reductase heme-binding subunit YedZ
MLIAMPQPNWPRRLKPLIFILCLLPLGGLIARAVLHQLGANPIEEIIHTTGLWALRMLLITLTITPLRRLSGWHGLLQWRRMLGLYAFFYASLHLASYAVLDQYFDWPAILEDIAKRPYIMAGMFAYSLLIPLAITSNNTLIRRMGGEAWRKLHSLVYPLSAAAILHYAWLVKADWRDPAIYGAILLGLLLARWQVKK